MTGSTAIHRDSPTWPRLCQAADDEILAWSLGKDAIVVTPDADFHTILAVSWGERTFRDSPANPGFGRPEGRRTGSAGTRRIRKRSEARISRQSKGAQNNVSPAAGRQFRLTLQAVRAFIVPNPRPWAEDGRFKSVGVGRPRWATWANAAHCSNLYIKETIALICLAADVDGAADCSSVPSGQSRRDPCYSDEFQACKRYCYTI